MPALPVTTVPRYPRVSISPALDRGLSHNAGIICQGARRHGPPESDVDELLQDVRIRLWRALATGEKIARIPASYVYRRARSAALGQIRHRRSRREDTFDWHQTERSLVDDSRPDHSVEHSEFLSRPAQTIAGLTLSRRVVVRMHLAGYHRLEIAKILGRSEAKTRNLLYRGLADLRLRLDWQVP